jgi:hypothetical protein
MFMRLALFRRLLNIVLALAVRILAATRKLFVMLRL